MEKLWVKVLMLLSISTSIYSYAWGLTGHRIIAEIAENHLDGRARRQIKKIMGQERLAYWANWPDFIKSDKTGMWKEASSWHYVNIDPQTDFKAFEEHLVPRDFPYQHTMEGSDDMPAHIKSSLMGCQIAIPITKGRLNLGTWQGVFLCEHRDQPHQRRLVLTVNG